MRHGSSGVPTWEQQANVHQAQHVGSPSPAWHGTAAVAWRRGVRMVGSRGGDVGPCEGRQTGPAMGRRLSVILVRGRGMVHDAGMRGLSTAAAGDVVMVAVGGARWGCGGGASSRARGRGRGKGSDSCEAVGLGRGREAARWWRQGEAAGRGWPWCVGCGGTVWPRVGNTRADCMFPTRGRPRAHAAIQRKAAGAIKWRVWPNNGVKIGAIF